MFVTTAEFSNNAIRYADEQHIILIDGQRLAQHIRKCSFKEIRAKLRREGYTVVQDIYDIVESFREILFSKKEEDIDTGWQRLSVWR